jgi:F-type H+-transporting ATPase subunit gamma
MANLKDIRTRIKSIKNTQKITQAMRMVAAAKVKKAEKSLMDARPYTALLMKMMAQVLPELPAFSDEMRESKYADVVNGREVRRVGLFVVAADRGLCGSYNSALLKHLQVVIKQYQTDGIIPRLYVVGNKAIRYVDSHHKDLEVLAKANGLAVPIEYVQADKAGETLLNAFINGQVDGIDVLYTKFNNMVSYTPTHENVLPLNVDDITYNVDDETLGSNSELEFEPNPISLIEEMLPMYLKRKLYGVLLESMASEQAARMTAMQNATENAKDLIHNLTLVYNKARQSAITQEIMEIVSGAEALR